MTSVGQQTAPNLSSDAPNGVTYAYRRFGNTETTRPPLLCLQHYRGTLDNWDPLFIDAVAEHGEVILLDNAGVGGSTGTVPRTVTEMARDAIVFVDALGLELVDVLGFSLGGMVAQELTLLRPWQVRRLILAGTAPRGGGHQTHGWTYDIFRASQAEPTGPEDFLHIFFDVTETSRAKGMDYLGRFLSRAENRDADNGPEVARAQYDAVVEWGIPEPSKLRRLAGITQPTLVANGMNDTMIPSINSQLLADNIPNARLRLRRGPRVLLSVSWGVRGPRRGIPRRTNRRVRERWTEYHAKEATCPNSRWAFTQERKKLVDDDESSVS